MRVKNTKTRPMPARRVMADTEVAPEAAELLFEASDVAEVIAEITGQDVEVEAEDTTVTFIVGEDEVTCEAEESDETVESSVKIRRAGRKSVAASTRTRRPVKAGRTVKKLPRRK